MRRALFGLALGVVACGGAPRQVVVQMPRLDGPIAARTTPDDALREKPPLATAIVSVVPPKIEERRLKNGIRVLFLERHDTPVMALRIVSDRGGDQADAGIPEFWTRAALLASESRPYWEINETTNALGMDMSADVTQDSTTVSIRVLSKLFEPATELAFDLIAHPSFPASRLTLVRQRMRAALSNFYGDPEGQLKAAVHHALFPQGHRYHDPVAPADSIDKVTADVLTAYQRFAFTPSHTTLAVVGDTKLDAMLPILERTFGGLDGPKVGPQAPPSPPPDVGPEPRFIVIDQPTGSQAHMAVAWLAPPDDTPDKFAFMIAADLLDDALFTELREKKGITYGTDLFGGFTRGRTPVGISTMVEIDHVGDAAQTMAKFAELLATQRLPDDQLASEKAALIGSRAYFDGIGKSADTLAMFATYAMPLDYPLVRAKGIVACSAEDVRVAAERWLSPTRLRIIVVGESAKVIPQLQQVSPGKVLRRSPFTW